jgi:hypothetical protein
LALLGLALITLAAIVCRRKPSQESVSLTGEKEDKAMDYGLSDVVAAGRPISSHLDSGFYRAGHGSVRVIPIPPGGQAKANEQSTARVGDERRRAARVAVAMVDQSRARSVRFASAGNLRGSATSSHARSAAPALAADQKAGPGSLNS